MHKRTPEEARAHVAAMDIELTRCEPFEETNEQLAAIDLAQTGEVIRLSREAPLAAPLPSPASSQPAGAPPKTSGDLSPPCAKCGRQVAPLRNGVCGWCEQFDAGRCIAETKVKRGVQTHTVRCEKLEHSDSAHEHHSVGHHVIWFGEARKVEDDTRWRFGFRPW